MPKDNKRNKHYSKEFKESVIKRLEHPTNDTVTSLSNELGIPRTTIYQWIKKSNTNSCNIKASKKWCSEDKFHVVLETSSFNERELAEYCRKKGIYLEDIKLWKKQCLNANNSTSEDTNKLKEDLKDEKNKSKTLEKELRLKEKALAETAALLVLRKKANAIWGDPEDE